MSVSPGRVKRRGPSLRLAWMLPAAIALLAGLDAGLILLGVPAPVTIARLAEVHGVILVLGFVATLISLERTVALGRWYGYIAPALLGVGGLIALTPPLPLIVGKCVLAAGTLALTLVYVPLWRRQYDAAQLTQLIGSALAFAGVLLWITGSSFAVIVPFLIAFLVLTIAAERVELGRLTMGPKAGTRLLIYTAVIIAALSVGLFWRDIGARLLGAVLILLVIWLVTHDVARRTIRATGVTRYMAACILAGYVWLATAAVVLLFGAPTTRATYDSIVHGVFLGYTFSMIMAHATTILPAVLRISLPYRAAFWVPAALLQVALIVRIWLGNGLGLHTAWITGGVLGVAALLLFFVTALISAIIGPKRQNRENRGR